MGQPGSGGNFGGYQESDIIHRQEKIDTFSIFSLGVLFVLQENFLKCRAADFHPTDKTMRKLYLVHGTRDDNVHLQHSMMLAKELVRQGIMFKQQVIQ